MARARGRRETNSRCWAAASSRFGPNLMSLAFPCTPCTPAPSRPPQTHCWPWPKTSGADRLHYGLEHEVDERQHCDEAVRSAFENAGKRVHAHHTQTLLPPDAVQTGTGGPYKVFTPYKRSVLKQLTAEEDLAVDLRPPAQPKPCVAIGTIPDAIEGTGTTVELETFDLNEHEALASLEAFLTERGGQYEAQRNFPAVAGTSALGVAFALGTLSPRTAYAHALRRLTSHPNEAEGLDTWISELVWRDFYRHVLFHFPRVCMNRPFDLSTEAVEWRNNEEEFQAWCEGRTGYPLVDAAQRCLVATGWMHNRLRMVTAQFLTKHLLVDWRWGERFFAQHLVDYDFASNNGGWQWSSSTGTDAARISECSTPSAKAKSSMQTVRLFASGCQSWPSCAGKTCTIRPASPRSCDRIWTTPS